MHGGLVLMTMPRCAGCTGNALTQDQASYRDAGADVVLVKPLTIRFVLSICFNLYSAHTSSGCSDFKRMLALAHQRRVVRRSRAQDDDEAEIPS